MVLLFNSVTVEVCGVITVEAGGAELALLH